MPISIRIKADYGDPIYLKNDPEQKQYTLVGVIGGPGYVRYDISNGVDNFVVYDFQTTFERNEALRLSFTGE